MDKKGNSGSKEDTTITGPYKATQMWNDVIQTFRDQLPCGRHRRIMKTFENCFSGSSAIDWLFNYLKSNKNFKTDLSREKAVSLVNKLYKAGIFEEVKVSKSMHHKAEVQENRLYRFLPMSPSKAKMIRLPLAPRNDAGVNHRQRDRPVMKSSDAEMKHDKPTHRSKEKTMKEVKVKSKQPEVKKSQAEEIPEHYPPCYLITKILSSKEVKETWEKMFIYKLKKTFGVSHHGDIVNESDVNGNHIMHNCVYVNKNGTVTNIATEDQFPHWVWSAMKCLARWPEPQEAGLPNYPGFEKDVFVVVKDHFLGLGQPLVPSSLYNAITNVFVFAGNHSSQDDKERQSVVDSLWTSASLDNIILNLAKKYNLLDGVETSYDHDVMLDRNQLYFGDSDCKDSNFVESQESLYKTNFSHFNNTDKNNLESRQNIHKKDPLNNLPNCDQTRDTNFVASDVHAQPKFVNLPDRKFGSMPNLKISKYETAFGPNNRTVTRVFYHNGICTDYRHCDEEQKDDPYFPIETHFDVGSERGRQFSQNVNFERVKSMENVNFREGLKNNYHMDVRPSIFARSKSFAGTDFPQEKRVESKSNLINKYGLGCKVLRENSLSVSTFQKDYSRYLCSSSCDRKVGIDNSFEKNNPSLRHEGRNIGNWVYPQGLPNKSFKHVSPESQTLPRNHGSPVIGRQHNGSYQTSNLSHARDQRPMHSSVDLRARETSPVDIVKASSFADIYSPLDSAAYGPGYRPVLDASKERKNGSIVDFTTSCQAPLRNAPHVKRSDRRHVTSTPLSPSCPKRQDFNIGSRRSAISLFGVTPLYGSNHRPYHKAQEHDYLAYPQTRLSEDRAKAYLQLITLLMPPACRRKLHILFRLMTKMIANPNLCLDPTQSTRSLVIATFYPAIVRPLAEEDCDEFFILQLVSFMLDCYDDIFTPPEDLKKQVNQRLKQMQRPQISFSPRQSTSMYFCQQTSVADYERKKKAVSQHALEDLLENIIKDQKMESKEKRHRLKQFQKTYPAIYSHRFPNPESEASVLPPKPRVKDVLIAKPLNKLKGLRL